MTEVWLNSTKGEIVSIMFTDRKLLIASLTVIALVAGSIGSLYVSSLKKEHNKSTYSGPSSLKITPPSDLPDVAVGGADKTSYSICISGCDTEQSGTPAAETSASVSNTAYGNQKTVTSTGTESSSFYNNAMSIINGLTAQTTPMPDFSRPPATYTPPATDPCAGIYTDSSDYGNCIDANY